MMSSAYDAIDDTGAHARALFAAGHKRVRMAMEPQRDGSTRFVAEPADDCDCPLCEEACPGEGKCHGCMVWCDQCGDTSKACNWPDCDVHNGEEEEPEQL